MTVFRYGHRIAKTALLRPSVAALIFDGDSGTVLLTRRSDNGCWCLPGGGIDPGESVEEACIREVLEETGLIVRVTRLVGVYSNPHKIIEYADGNKYQGVTITFESQIIGGQLCLNEETTEFKYFSADQLDDPEVMDGTRERVVDALVDTGEAFIK